MRTVRDVMSGDIEVLRTTESVTEAACYLAAHDEDTVPLCLSDGSLAGMVSARDIVAKVVAKGLDPREVTLAELAVPADALALDVGIPVEEAVAIMARHQRARLPVTDCNRVVGLVTRRDMARSLAFIAPWGDD
jgi:CBS domain-containing protein